jgi:pterin-4a-carbinolamine dehydratase
MTAALGSEPFRFCNFQETLNFVRKVGDLAETEGHQPDISFGWAIRDHLAVTKRTAREPICQCEQVYRSDGAPDRQ